MLFVIWGKIKNNKWLVASLLVGNILLVAIVSSIPTYSQAILQRIYMKNLEQLQEDTGVYPGLVQMNVTRLGMRGDVGRRDEIMRFDKIAREQIEPDFGVGALMRSARANTAVWRMTPTVERSDTPSLSMRIEAATDFDGMVELVAGRMPSGEAVPWEESDTYKNSGGATATTVSAAAGGVGVHPEEEDIPPARMIEVIAHEELFMGSGFLLGDEYIMKSLRDADDRPYAVKIVGVFRAAPGSDLYWAPAQYQMRSSLFSDYALFIQLFLAESDAENISDYRWDVSLDYHGFRADGIDALLATNNRYAALGPSNYYRYTEQFSETARGFVVKSRQLNLTLWVLVAPILVLLAFFVSMVSRQIIVLDQNEISVIKSRGATSGQVFLIYLGMSVFLAIISLGVGIPIGYATCGVIGASSGFLEFVSRTGLDLEPMPLSFFVAGGAAFATVAAMAIPAVRASRATIVAHKQRAAAKKRPLWRVLFVDLILLAFSVYELYIYTNQRELLSQRAAGGASVDPLLFMSSSLFMLGAALLFVRLMSHAVRLFYLAGRDVWPPSLYASLLRVIRASGEEQFIIIFLVLTLATGVFNARVARTVNLNNEHAIRYEMGADLVLKEEWQINARHSVAVVSDSGGVTYEEVVYYEPDFSRYQSIAGAESVTKVYRTDSGQVQSGQVQSTSVQILGIRSDEFGRTAWMRDGLLPSHFNHYLNALAQNPDALIVSGHFRDKHNMQLGDRLSFTADKKNFSGVICGFVDYWPSYDPLLERRDYNGNVTIEDRYLIVANLAKMQRTQGVLPYEVWIRSAGGDTEFIYNAINGGSLSGVLFTKFDDVRTGLVDAKNDPVFQGTNGILTIGFIAILLVCAAGFLIYWILSIRSRELQFGIFRAMGLGMRSVLAMLGCEQALISGVSILAGVGVGTLVSDHFVSLIQIGYSTGSRLPLITASDSMDTVRLFVVMGVMLAVCMAALGVTVRNIRIAQALKLGEE